MSKVLLCFYAALVMTYDACTSENSRALTVASLQRLKMETVIPAPADCQVRPVIKFSNAQSIVSCARSMTSHGSTVNTSPAAVQLGGV